MSGTDWTRCSLVDEANDGGGAGGWFGDSL